MLVVVLAAAVRIGYVLLTAHTPIINDGWYHHQGALLLADGKGWIAPSHPLFGALTGRPAVQDALQPPGWRATLGLVSLLRIRSVLGQQLVSALIGTASVAFVALAGRRVAGPSVGLIAGVIGAVYPGFWIYERELLIETLLIPEIAITLLLAYRYLDAPSSKRLAVVALMCGLLTMTRAEQILLVPFLLLPLALHDRKAPLRRRFVRFATGGAICCLVILPWFAFNTTRFDKPVPVSNGLGYTVMVSNCAQTYSGERLGYFGACGYRSKVGRKAMGIPDQSVADGAMRRIGMRYGRRHAGRLPIVLAAREARTNWLFRPVQQVRFQQDEKAIGQRDSASERSRVDHGPNTGASGVAPYLWMITGLIIMPFALYGTTVLLHRHRPIYPLMAFVLTVAIASAMAFGQPRYRAASEVSFVILAAVALEAIGSRARRRIRPHQTIGT